MTGPEHRYAVDLRWTGDRGTGTSGYRDYDRSYEVRCEGKPALAGSADPTFRGDRTQWNPEEMLLSALSSCHMLSYLHVCSDAGITVFEYTDAAEACMKLNGDGSGRFTSVMLRPRVTIAATGDPETATALHELAHQKCFIANSVDFPVTCSARTELAR